jgi:hypothetical protein
VVVSGWPIRLNNGFDSRLVAVISFYPLLIRFATSSNVVTVNSQRKYRTFFMLSLIGYKLFVTRHIISFAYSPAPENIVFPHDIAQPGSKHLNNALTGRAKLSPPARLRGLSYAKFRFPSYAVKYVDAKLRSAGMKSNLPLFDLKNRLVLFDLSTRGLLEEVKAKKNH